MKEGMVRSQWTVGVNSTMTALLDKKNESINLSGHIWLDADVLE